MYDIRKIQEQVIYNAVKSASDDETANKIVNWEHENNPTWVKNTMKRLEDNFDAATLKIVRMNCQCGYGMDEKLALLNELVKSSHSLEEFASSSKAREAGLSYKNGELYL
jgi:hypothetical protein